MLFVIFMIFLFLYCFVGAMLGKLFEFIYDNFEIGEIQADCIDTAPNLFIGTWPVLLLLFVIELMFWSPCFLAKLIFRIE